MRDLAECVLLLEPQPRRSTLAWCREFLCTDAGRPYDHDAYPHLGAPGGPFDAFDDPRVQSVWMQFATRLGKTFFGQACQIATAALDPAPMMFCSADKKLALEVVARTYRMLERTPLLKEMLSEAARRDDYVALGRAEWFVAWGTSIKTLADKQVKIGHGSEIDKYPHYTTSTEADPLRLLLNRGKDFPTRKFILETTPTIKGKSRVERGRLRSDNRQFLVPCPKCGVYQRLRFQQKGGDPLTPGPSPAEGRGETGGRGCVVWDHLENGRSDPDLAYRTARYVCAECGAAIKDHHRAKMMRAGVWVPEGCGVDRDRALLAAEKRREDAESRLAYLTGQPLRRGPDAGFQLPSWYALSLTWGDMAKEFVTVCDRPADLQDFVNSWAAETWERIAARQTWEQLGLRMIVGVPAGEVPTWASLLTLGVDKQADFYRWTAVAWGPGFRGHILAYGTCEKLDELRGLLTREWRYQDDGVRRDTWPTLKIDGTLIDSGFRPRDVGAFCRACQRKGLKVWPSKGSSSPLDSAYAKKRQGPDKALPGMLLILVDTRISQDWIDHALHTLTPADPGGLSLYHDALANHQDVLEQLLNEQPVTKLNQQQHAVETWDRADETLPNDYRDCVRQAWVAMLLHTRGQAIRERGAGVRRRREARKVLRMPDGRPFLVTER